MADSTIPAVNHEPIAFGNADRSAPAAVVAGGRHGLAAGALVLLAVFVYCYAGIVMTLAGQWRTNESYSHGFVVPLISLYLAWHRRDLWRHLKPAPDYLFGPLVFLMAGALLLVGRAGSLLVVQQLSMLVMLAGCILLLLGRQFLRALALPLAYLLLMIPIWEEVLTGRLHMPLQRFTAWVAVTALHALGIPAHRQDTFIELSTLTLEVARGCSGVNQLFAVVAVAVPAAYLFLRQTWRRVVLIAFAIVVAALGNASRVALIGVLCHLGWADASAIHGPGHVLQALAVAAVGYLGIFVGLAWLSRGNPPDTRIDQPTRLSLAPFYGKPNVALTVVSAVLALIVVGARSRDVLSNPVHVAPRVPLHNFPERIADWTAVPSSPSLPALRATGADDELVRTYRAASGATVALYVGYHRYQEQGKEIVGDATALAIEPTIDRLTLQLSPTESFQVNQLVDGQQPGRALFWYYVDGAAVGRGPQAKLQTIWSALTERRTNGALVTLRWAPPAGVDDMSPQDVAAFIRPLLPVLHQYIS